MSPFEQILSITFVNNLDDVTNVCKYSFNI